MVSVEMQQHEKLIDDLTRSLDFKRLSQDVQAFCPFAALNIVRQEIRHSAFLAWCLAPEGAHGWGADFLLAFLKAAAPDLNLEDCNSRDAWAEREWRNIDIVIEVPRNNGLALVVAVEMKVDATQGEDQLLNYRTRIEEHWPQAERVYLFLRQRDEEPNDNEWASIDFGTVADALQIFWSTPPRGDLGALQLLSYYRHLLNREFVMNSSLEKLARSLWRDHAAVLTYLADHRPDQKWYGLMDFLRDAKARMAGNFEGSPGEWLAKNMSPSGHDLQMIDPGSNTLIRFAFKELLMYPQYNIGQKQWAGGPILMVELFVRPESISIKLMLGPQQDNGQDLRGAIKDVFGNNSRSAQYSSMGSKVLKRWKDEGEIEVSKLVEDIAKDGKKFLDGLLTDDRWERLRNVLRIARIPK